MDVAQQNCAVLHGIARSADIIFLKSPIHRPAADPQQTGSLGNIPIGFLQGISDCLGVITPVVVR